MKIKQMFPENKAIDRPINGVIKVMGSDDPASKENRRQELEEYVITRELQIHFNRFFDYYEKSIDGPTEQMGVWISGFFGCGKSHLLKIIRYLLENKEVDGIKPLELFKEKFSYDQLMFARVKRCVSVPTDVILFNIDSKSPMGKTDDVILRVFTKVFYEKCGYYGDDMKVAAFERFLDQQGKLAAFKTRFEDINGEPWEKGRESFAFWEDDIIQALTEVTGITENAARNWFNGEETAEISIDRLTREINEYIATKPASYRLLFLVDEVGQYIGDNSKLMLNLQTVVEELGVKCHGRAWVIVTSQEDIDSVTKVKGNDFSKILGRFNRLSLSSSSVDEVINRRLLEKNDDARQLLGLLYQQNASAMRNLFMFSQGSRGDLKGYESEESFIASYPFVPYQYKLLQQVLMEIRKHGSSGKHLSSGARSMLSAFQEAAMTIMDHQEGVLVPFCRFYDSVVTFLEGRISGVIDRAWRAAVDHNGLEPEDLDVLKLLFLLKDVQDMPSNLENLTVLMIDRLNAEKVTLRQRIMASLDRLEEQNYIAHLGDLYRFLNDDEQDINRAIREMSVDPSEVTREIGTVLYGDTLGNYRKVRYKDRNDYSLDQYIDDSAVTSATSNIRLRFITSESDYSTDSVDEQGLMLRSRQNEVIVLLSRDYDYASELREKLRIVKYVKQKVLSKLPESIREIISKKQRDASEHEALAKKLLIEAVLHGTFFVYGDRLTPVGSTVKEKVDDAMSRLIEAVYSKLMLLNKPVKTDAEVSTILSTPVSEDTLMGADYANREALADMAQHLEIQKAKNSAATVGTLMKQYQEPPYGWTQTDIAGLIASLLAGHRVQLTYGGTPLKPNDKTRILNCLLKKTEYDKAVVKIQPHPGEQLMREARAAAREIWGLMNISDDEIGLCEEIERLLSFSRKGNNNLSNNFLAGKDYPGKSVLDEGEHLFAMLLGKTSDPVAFLDALVREKEHLLDWKEDQHEVDFFFKNQRDIFDRATGLAGIVKKEQDYFAEEREALEAWRTVTTILSMPKPYRHISELPTLSQAIDAAYTRVRNAKRATVHENVVQARGDIHTLAGNDSDARKLSAKADEQLEKYEQDAVDSTNATELDAIVTKIHAHKNLVCHQIEQLLASKKPPIGSVDEDKPKKPKQLRRYDVFPSKRLSCVADVDAYVVSMRQKLLDELSGDNSIDLI